MNWPRVSMRSSLLVLVAVAPFVIGLVGCENPEGIRSYTVKKNPPSSRMIAAIVPHGSDAWFFKMTGANNAVTAHAENFDALLKSLTFSDSGSAGPQWKLPPGWSEKPGDGMRFATLVADVNGEDLECTVSKLPRTDQPLDEYLLANINRWRNQMRLPAMEVADLPKETTKVQLPANLEATVINIAGEMSSSGSPPFASGGMPPPRRGFSEASPPSTGSKIAFQTPSGWKEGQLEISRGGVSIRRDAVFEVRDGERRVEVTVTKLPAAAGALLPNVNRWRGQIGLGEIAADELKKETKQLEFAGSAADYVQFNGEQQAILGVIAERSGLVWFVKLQGDRELAERERENFESFVQSIRLE